MRTGDNIVHHVYDDDDKNVVMMLMVMFVKTGSSFQKSRSCKSLIYQDWREDVVAFMFSSRKCSLNANEISRVAVLENQNKALIEELKSLKELYTGNLLECTF